MNLPQSATVDGLDYEKLTDSRFVTMVIAHQRRTNRAIGINQNGNAELGLMLFRQRLTEQAIIDGWLSILDKSADKIAELRQRFEAGEIDRETALRQAEILQKLAGAKNA